MAPKLKVAVVGGGSVGLSFAVYLAQLGKCEIHIFESASAFTEIGAGIEVGYNALKVYKEMGIADEIHEFARDSSGDPSNIWFDVIFGDGRHGLTPIHTLRTPEDSTKLHRADLLSLLVSRLPKENVYFRKHLTTYEQMPGGGIKLHFRDGSTFDADVLVGSDGIKSTGRVRRVMYADKPEDAEPTWSATIAYRALLPISEVVRKLGEHTGRTPTLRLTASGQHIILFPVSHGKYMNLVAFVSDFTLGRHPTWPKQNWIEPSSAQEMLEDYEGWMEPVRSMLAGVEKVQRWAIFEVPLLASFVSGNVVLVGDAAHASTPHGGNGASQGIEDGHVLAQLLSHPLTTPATVSLVLKAYDAVRRPRAQAWQEAAYATGLVYECCGAEGDDEARVVQALEGRMDWVWGVGIHEQVGRAVRVFEESLRG
ncbi:FAD/NAD(P)-binding domain-containing protein [Calocera viscosa TUFC12733]|uniref:FAD/NAD(P)-binding domain-containing protein n=1 Tax=Calocera viscosa (strain TUFC12733) TaxID=1330018 RepID=A0A167HF95_CALVF|nr:FAD/NAD(P)-binding domain-containing protein [Calocera viscosa TUFC12733]